MNQKDRIIEMHTDIKWIKKTLNNNVEDVRELQNWKSKIIGIAVGVSAIGTFIINYIFGALK